MSNNKDKMPIIERIVIIGLDNAELQLLKSKSLDDLNKTKSKKNGNVIGTYSSIHCSEEMDKDIIANISYYCYPQGIIDISPSPLKKRSYISFTLELKSARKHCTCLSINTIIHSCSSYVLSVNTGVVLISSRDLYTSHKEILVRLFEIIHTSNSNPSPSIYASMSSGGRSNSISAVNSLLYSSQLSTITTSKIEEYSSIDFFFSFILNSLYFTKSAYGNLSNSLCVNIISNNFKQNFFLFKLYLDDNGNESVLSLKDYDVSILLEKFYAEDLVKIYLAMLMESRIILVYDSTFSLNEMNMIVNSLIALVFPLPSRHYVLIPYLNQSNIKESVLNVSQGIIIGIDYHHYLSIEKELKISKTIVYSLIRKKMIYSNEGFPSIPIKTQNEITGNLYQTLAEKLSINAELSFEDTELGQMFEERTCVKINTILYFNMKVICIFYQLFLKIISLFSSYIKFETPKPQSSSVPNRTQTPFTGNSTLDLFDYSKYKQDNISNQSPYQKFLNGFINSKMFTLFIRKYVHNYKSKAKYRFINQIVDVMAPKKNFNQSLKRTFNLCIKKKITEYYNFTYINYAKAYDSYMAQVNKAKEGLYLNYSSSTSNNTLYHPISALFKVSSALVRKGNNDYENFLIKKTEAIQKCELYNIYKEIQSASSAATSHKSPSVNQSSYINNNETTSTPIDNTMPKVSCNQNEISSPMPVSSFDLNIKSKNNEATIPTSQFFNKEEIMVINEEFKFLNSSSNEKQLLTESKLFQMPLASKQPIQMGSILQSKNIEKASNPLSLSKYSAHTKTNAKKTMSKNKNETIGQQIKAKLHSNYMSNVVNSASNKNLALLIKNMSLASSKMNTSGRYDLPIQNEVYSTRNAHSAIKRDIINMNHNSINKKTNVNDNNLPKLEGDNDCDIFSEND